MQDAPAMTPALACAPLIPPRPEVTNVIPDRESPAPQNILAALSTVIVVPWTIPCGPIYMYEPAVIWPYWLTPSAFILS